MATNAIEQEKIRLELRIALGAARRAYEAFCSSFGRSLPMGTPTWDELPEKLQASWKAAAAAARD